MLLMVGFVFMNELVDALGFDFIKTAIGLDILVGLISCLVTYMRKSRQSQETYPITTAM